LCCCHDYVLTRLLCEYYLAAKEREKAQKLAAQKKAAEAQAASRVASRAISPTPKSPKDAKTAKTGTASRAAKPTGSGPSAPEQRNIDVSALGLGVEERSPVQEEPPRMALAREKVLEEAARALEAESKGQAGISLVVIGEPGTVPILSRGFLIRSRPCRCWEIDTYGKVAL
jgi:elongation factor 1 alpha-like protein